MPSELYAVKGLFRWYLKETDETTDVEERIVLIKADGLDEAISLAEQEAMIYCAEDATANFAIEPLGWWDAYLIGSDPLSEGTEIYSRLTITSLSGNDFLRKYYPPKGEK